MIFLLEYNRPQEKLVTFKVFDDSDGRGAEKLRLDLELELSRKGIDHEVVLLQAASEEALRRTHRRYFETPSQIAMSAINAMNSC